MSRLTLNLTLVVFCLNILVTHGQSKKLIKETFYEGEMFLLYEEYVEAKTMYDTLISWFPENDNYKYRLGICYLNIPGEKDKSLDYLQEAVQNINPNYKDGKVKETAAAYDAWYYLAKAYLVTNQVDKAITTYKRFLEGMDHKLYDSTLVKKELEECYNAKRLMEYPLYLKSVNQGDIINDRFSDINPVVSADEKTMIYTRETALQDQIFFSRKVNGEWTPGLVIMDQLLVDEGNSTSLSADGTELFIYQNDSYDGNIYSSRFVDGRWQPARILNENINTKYWESHASVSNDGKKLFFTSNRPGGYGGLDIYVSERDNLGEWGPALNLGPGVNTPFNEESPFLDRTDKVLFFSSRGHFNMGGHDIFYTTQNPSGEWITPINMGYPLNSTDDDIFYHPVGQGYTAYYSRFDPDGFGQKDIFRIEIFSDDHPRKFFVRGMVKLRDLISQFSDSVKISTLDRKNMDTLLVVYSDPETGEYEFEIPQGEYKLVYESDGSEKNVTDLEIDLHHPADSISVPELELFKTDLVAEIHVLEIDSLSSVIQGDTASINIATEPFSILRVEQWQGDKLLSAEEFLVTDSIFKYRTIPSADDVDLKFIITDRFNNKTIAEHKLLTVEPEEIKTIVEPELILADLQTDTVSITQQIVRDPSIEKLDSLITEVSDDRDIKEAIEKTKEKQIKNVGDWLESIYTIVIEDGAEQDILTRLMAALSADLDESAEDYLKKLYKYAGANLRSAIDDFDMSDIKANTPEELIEFLLGNAAKYGYTRNEVFEAVAKLINEDKKTAEEIVDYIEKSEKNNLWIVWPVLAGSAFLGYTFWRRRKVKIKK
ncbi:MAG: tetratricopeptide repeat protein [Marinilabiliaceae bacterium]|jgi:tetratricopeptide (TPR) repeat protein|nr:tetratricopeptide repeat protein [Marinilabiliaceae bacterium]